MAKEEIHTPNMVGSGYSQLTGNILKVNQQIGFDPEWLRATESERLTLFSSETLKGLDNSIRDILRRKKESLVNISPEDLRRAQGCIEGIKMVQELIKQLKPKEE